MLTIALASLAALPLGGAAAPRARQCPKIVVSCIDLISPVGVPATFTASIEGAPADAKLTYNWAVSTGTISSGQGTSSITVDTTGLPDGELKATVEVKGFPEACPASTSCTSAVIGIRDPHDKVDEYGNISVEDEQARLDNFAVGVQSWPEGVGYIVAYGGRRSRRGEALRRAARAKRYLVTVRAIPADRLVTIDGGYRELLTVELRIRPKDFPPPTPYATVDPKDVRFIQARPKHRARRR